MVPGGELEEEALNALFEAAKRSPVSEAPAGIEPLEVPPDLMARVLADALAAQPQPAPARAPGPAPEPKWQSLQAAFGGWFGLGGLAVAGVTGLAIGLVSPEFLNSGFAIGLGSTDATQTLVVDPLDTFEVSLFFEEPGL